jgi:hypothetical protein
LCERQRDCLIAVPGLGFVAPSPSSITHRTTLVQEPMSGVDVCT